MAGVSWGDGLAFPFLQACGHSASLESSQRLNLRDGFMAGWVRWYAGH